MKGFLAIIMRAFSRSMDTDLSDAVRAESRARIARQVASGNAWDGLKENAALLGINADSSTRPRMVFAARR